MVGGVNCNTLIIMHILLLCLFFSETAGVFNTPLTRSNISYSRKGFINIDRVRKRMN